MAAKNPHAAALGKLGGSVSSEAKTLAARANASKKRPNSKGRKLGAKDKQPRKRRKPADPQ